MDLQAFRDAALGLPETSEEPHHHMSSFRVRGKIFVTLPPGDEFVHIFVDEEDRQRALAIDPDGFEKLMWGKNAVGLRAFVDHADHELCVELMRIAWRRKAPASLVLPPADLDT